MKPLVALLITFLTAFASPSLRAESRDAAEFMAKFAESSALTRAVGAYQLCKNLFDIWREPTYQTSMESICAAAGDQSEAAYYLIKTCNTMWMANFLDPQKALQIRRTQDHISTAQAFANLDLLEAGNHFREQVKVSVALQLSTDGSLPKSPYEMCSRQASNDRELEESLAYEKRRALSSLAVTGGSLALLIRSITKSMPATAATVEGFKGRIALLAIATYIGGELVDAGLWQVRSYNLWQPIGDLTRKLSIDTNPVTRQVLLDEFYRANERLGYFYTYSLYLAESGRDQTKPVVNEDCYEEQKKIFNGRQGSIDLTPKFLKHTVCEDAATLWQAAGQFLRKQLPTDAAARLVADRLLSRAKRTYIGYEETKAFELTQPICRPFLTWTGEEVGLECTDRRTGVRTFLGKEI